ncbi:BON domain-containing protein [Streptomyces sp. NPDC101110]|uniref:BON domain-containing protein n=1 Tax=unclassified Streptomyces TaxID=2593676 RepID=UPI00380D34DE
MPSGPTPEPVPVDVTGGVVTLTGQVRDTSSVPIVACVVRSVEGVVDVGRALSGGMRATGPG